MSVRRTVAASTALALAAVGLVGVVAPASDDSDGARAVAGTSGPDAAFKRSSQVTRAHRKSASAFATRTSPVPGSSSYTFTTLLDGQPVRWDPCTPIRWTANVSRGPAGGLDVLKAAVARVALVTGTRWELVGTTTTTPDSGYLPTRAQSAYPPVLIGWTDGSSSDLLAGQTRTVLGMTRTAWFGVQMPDGSRVAATRAAVIALDRTDALPLRGSSSWSTVALHELAHAMGLGHVADPTQLMASVLPPVTDLQAGDQNGLTKVGRSAGCVVVPTS